MAAGAKHAHVRPAELLAAVAGIRHVAHERAAAGGRAAAHTRAAERQDYSLSGLQWLRRRI
jgi:hypothetical protein